MIKMKTKSSNTTSRLTFDVIKQFIEQSKTYTITKILVTKDNLCYGVLVDPFDGYIPVHLSHFKYQTSIDISFNSKDIKRASVGKLQEFIKRYNNWVAHESERKGYVKVDVSLRQPLLDRIEPIYPLVLIDRWLVDPLGKCIAFTSAGLNFYIIGISQAEALKISKNSKFQEIPYDPLKVNTLLEVNAMGKDDERTRKLSISLYNNYIYQLLVLEFIQLFNKHRNLKIREQVKRLIMKTDFKQSTVGLIEKLSDVILKGFDKDSTALVADIEKIKAQIVDFILSGDISKTKLLKSIDSEYYNFDMILVERLKRMPSKDVLVHLKRLSSGIVTSSGSINNKDFVFPNILQSCNGSKTLGYCSNGKLIISKDNLNRYLEVLSDQIKNPFVEKYLFSPLFQNSLIDYFLFNRNSNETIEIEFL